MAVISKQNKLIEKRSQITPLSDYQLTNIATIKHVLLKDTHWKDISTYDFLNKMKATSFFPVDKWNTFTKC